MIVHIGKLSGFCAGVKYAVSTVEKLLNESNEKIYCLGELIHNRQVINQLEEKGMVVISSIDEAEDGSTVIIRAHGEPVTTYETAKARNINIVDLTCGNVKVIHNKIIKEKENSFIIIVGNKNHPEVIASKSFAGDNSYVIESEDDILDAYMEYEKTLLGRVYVVSQTTMLEEKFEELSKEIETNFAEAEVTVDNTICLATENRQLEVAKMARKYNTMVIIGGKNSSNTKELARVSEEYAKNVYLIETVEDLKNYTLPKDEEIGIMAGASTPDSSVEAVKNYLENL